MLDAVHNHLAETNTPPKKKSRSMLWVGLSVFGLFCLIMYPIVDRQVRRSRATSATCSLKDIYQGLRDFSQSYGSSVGNDSGRKLDPSFSGSSANDYLRLLFRAGIVSDELPFYTRGVKGTHKGDQDTSGGNALAPGECSFTVYTQTGGTIKLKDGPVTYGRHHGVPIIDVANAPLMATPCIKAGTYASSDNLFDYHAFHGRAVILRADGSAVSFGVNEDGTLQGVELKGYDGKSILHHYTAILPEKKE